MRPRSEITPWITGAVLVPEPTTSIRAGSSLGVGQEKGVPQGKNSDQADPGAPTAEGAAGPDLAPGLAQ